jgi:hypothetical protein
MCTLDWQFSKDHSTNRTTFYKTICSWPCWGIRICPSSHRDSSSNCCTWSCFLSLSLLHLYISWFVVDDNSFILGLLSYGWLSFCCHESSLHMIFTWFLFCWLFAFVWVVSTCVHICLALLLMDGFPSLIFIYRVFLLGHSNTMSVPLQHTKCDRPRKGSIYNT